MLHQVPSDVEGHNGNMKARCGAARVMSQSSKCLPAPFGAEMRGATEKWHAHARSHDVHVDRAWFRLRGGTEQVLWEEACSDVALLPAFWAEMRRGVGECTVSCWLSATRDASCFHVGELDINQVGTRPICAFLSRAKWATHPRQSSCSW